VSRELSADEVDAVRQMRGFAVPWAVVAAKLKRSVDECRAAIGLPPLPRSEPPAALPWSNEAQQRRLFE
jgi:hypothetical protein